MNHGNYRLQFILLKDREKVITKALAGKLGFTHHVIMARDLVGDTSGATEALIKRFTTSINTLHHILLVIEEVDVIAHDKEKNFDDRAFLTFQQYGTLTYSSY